MATREMLYAYRPLLRATHRTPLVPRRTICYTRPLRAEENPNGTNAEELKEKQSRSSAIFSSMKDLLFGASKPKKPKRPPTLQRRGSLSTDSIFADHHQRDSMPESETTPQGEESPEKKIPTLEKRDYDKMLMALDPNPKARKRWERRMIIKEIRRRGRLTKQEMIMATEREALVKSHWFKTSVKKLVPLARQIRGKNVDDAILQMRFSKKKAAKDVLEHLEHAKNMAIVRYGMGLGKVNGESSNAEPVTITLKNGEKKTITDPTSIYIAQAWVNRGPFDVEFDHRARGKINLMRPPHTGLSVLLKEEKTQIREWKDREKRALRQRKSMLWVHLPDRPISAQNQYYSW